MATTVNITKSGRQENLATLSGAFTLSVNAVDNLDQIVSAGTEEETAMGGFSDRQLRALVLRCDQPGRAEFLGVRYPILETTNAGPSTITHTGDLEQEIAPGDVVRIEGTVGGNGYYLVAIVNEAIGVTTLSLAAGQLIPAIGEGAVGTVARVCSRQDLDYAYDIAALGGTLTAATGIIDMPLNLTEKFVAGDIITMRQSFGNNGIWRIVTVTLGGLGTEIVVRDLNDAGLLVDDTNDGNFQLARLSFALAANAPMLWDIDNGLQNPFAAATWAPIGGGEPDNLYNTDRGDVEHCMVTVPGAVNGQFDGLIAKNPDLL